MRFVALQQNTTSAMTPAALIAMTSQSGKNGAVRQGSPMS
jgi:hypothetical protein